MSARVRSRSVLFLLLLLILVLLLAAVLPAGAKPVVPAGPKHIKVKHKKQQITLADYELIGTVNIPTGAMFEDTEIGGLSSITYDRKRAVYYAISDDQGTIDPVRYYTLAIDVADGSLDAGDITFLDVTQILDRRGKPYAEGSIDPEGLVLARQGQLYYTSEGFSNVSPPVEPFIKRMNLNGRQTRPVQVPAKYLPNEAGTQGVRLNLAFESLNVTPDQHWLWTAVEGALAQDGPAAGVNQQSWARMLQYRLSSGRPVREYVYVVNPLAAEPVPPSGFGVNGLVELLPLDNVGTMLAMERSFSVGKGNTVWLNEIETKDATDVSRLFSLVDPPATFVPVTKRLILNVETDLGIEPDNLEGMAFGPPLADGRLPLILVSDNNFSPGQVTQFIALAVTLDVVN